MAEACSCAEVRAMIEEILAAQGGGGKRAKRALSGYNVFVRECTRGGRSDLKSCAGRYKSLSEQEKKRYKEMATRAN